MIKVGLVNSRKIKKVIVIDNYHSIPDKLKSHIDLLLKGYVVDYNEDNKLLKLTKLKFICLIETISTINYESNYILKDNKLKVIDFFADKNLCYRYLDFRLQKQISCSSMLNNMKDLLRFSRKLFILDKWKKDDRLNFDTIEEINESIEKGNGKTYVNSTFTMLINEFNGTIDDFLSKWNQYCNSLKFPIVNEIFSSYEDPEILYN